MGKGGLSSTTHDIVNIPRDRGSGTQCSLSVACQAEACRSMHDSTTFDSLFGAFVLIGHDTRP